MEIESSKVEFLKEFSEIFGSEKEVLRALDLMENIYTNLEPDSKSIKHNIGVARIILKLGLEKKVVIAALLHNAIQYQGHRKIIGENFGNEIFEIIDSIARFENALSYNKEEKDIARKKLLIVLTTNPSVVMIKIAEMLDRLRNIENAPENTRNGFLLQIKEIYAPLAHKLSIYSISSEMNDLAFKYEDTQAYEEIENSMEKITRQTTSAIERARIIIIEALKKNGIKADVAGRIKTKYSTFSKMKRKNVDITKIYDLIALRAITNSIKECYEALGIIQSVWKPVPGEFDDYIAKPKENGYSSLHTSVYTNEGIPIEIQIRTKEMQDFAEFGVASHWKYKGEKKDQKYDKKIEWIKQVIDWERSVRRDAEVDIFGKEVFALTPKGELIELPGGATAIDFAYAVHSDIGDKCTGARINSIMVPLETKIRNGDIVEIITSSKQTPQMNWLTFAKTLKARQKIMSKFKVRSTIAPTKLIFGNYIKTTNTKVRLAKCCNPLPGDYIIGIKTTKRKISVHTRDCQELKNLQTPTIDVKWDNKLAYYDTNIIVHASDRLGILRDILEVFSRNNIYVASANAAASASNTAQCRFVVRIKNTEQLEQIKNKILNVSGVAKVYRE